MSASQSDAKVSITVEFRCNLLRAMLSYGELTLHSGGLEMLFSNERKLALSLPSKDSSGASTTVASLVDYLCENAMKDPRKELFVLDGTVYV